MCYNPGDDEGVPRPLPGLHQALSEIWEFPARSRYGRGDLCSECGQREAFEGDYIGLRIADHLARLSQHR